MSEQNNVNDDLVENVILTKNYIIKSAHNSVDVNDTKESYEEYFKLGGTVAKMSHMSTKNYANFVRKRCFVDDKKK